MNTTEQTSDPTLWRYPSLWSANRTIHLRNLESALSVARCLLEETKPFRVVNPWHYDEWIDRRDAWLSANTPTGTKQ